MVGENNSGRVCPICLERVSGEAFLDQCFHLFCYHCILQWTETALSRSQSTTSRQQCLKCPLCKTHYTSIIHDLSGDKFQRHYLLTSGGTKLLRSDAHIRRAAVYRSISTQQSSRLTSVVPKPNRWLSCWVQRELQALMQEEDVETVTQHVVGVVAAFNRRFGDQAGISAKKRTLAKDLDWVTTISTALRPFIFELSEKFAEELGSFLVSGLDIAAYDHRSQLVASATQGLSIIKSGDGISPKEVYCKIFDLYDEDIDEDGAHLMVGRLSTEVQSPPAEESLEEMGRHNHKEDIRVKGHKYSRGETVEERLKKKPVKGSVHNHEDSDRGRRHRREKRKKRKKREKSRISPSTSSSPPRDRHSHKHKRIKGQVRKESKSPRTKDRKLSREGKASRSHRRHSKRRKSPESSSLSTSSSIDSYRSRSSRSQTRSREVVKVKALKGLDSVKRTVAGNSYIGRNYVQGDNNRFAGIETRSRECQEESSHGKSQETLKNVEVSDLLEGHTSPQRQNLSTLWEAPDSPRTENYWDKGIDQSMPSKQAAGHMDETEFLFSSSAVRPDRKRLESAIGGLASSSVEIDTVRTPRIASPDKQFPQVYRLDGYDQESKTIEKKLREQALANLRRHLNQKDTGFSHQSRAVKNIISTRKVTQDVEGSSPRMAGPISSFQPNPLIEETVHVQKKYKTAEIWHGVEELPVQNLEMTHAESLKPALCIGKSLPLDKNSSISVAESDSFPILKGNACSDVSPTGLIVCKKCGTAPTNIFNSKVGKSLDVIRDAHEPVMLLNKPDEHVSGKEYRTAESADKLLAVSYGESFNAVTSTAVSDANSSEVETGQRERKRCKLIRNFEGSQLNEGAVSKNQATCEKQNVVQQEGKFPPEAPQANSSDASLQRKMERVSTDSSHQQGKVIHRCDVVMEARLATGQLSPNLHTEASKSAADWKDGDGLVALLPVNHGEYGAVQCSDSGAHRDNLADASDKIEYSTVKVALPKGKEGDMAGDTHKFQEKSITVNRGGETVQVSYKVYIPPRAAAAAARRRLQR